MSDLLGHPTRLEVLHELSRELQKRREVFPRWVSAGKLTMDEARKRVDRLQAAYDFCMHAMPEDGRHA